MKSAMQLATRFFSSSSKSGRLNNPRTILLNPSNDNYTTVNIWKPTYESLGELDTAPPATNTNNAREGIKPFSFVAGLLGGHVGHVSVKTRLFYASIYPDSANKPAIHKGEPVPLGFVDNFSKDLRALGNPHLTISYFCLNIEMMAKFYEQIKEGKTASYQAFNLRPSFLFTPSSTFNCSDLGLKLLEVGGIFELIPAPRSYISKILLFQTPNIVANTLKKAKIQEERMFPEVKNMKETEKSFEDTKKVKR